MLFSLFWLCGVEVADVVCPLGTFFTGFTLAPGADELVAGINFVIFPTAFVRPSRKTFYHRKRKNL